MKSIAIIGAGISGLAAAHLLNDRFKVTVFEKESSPGGLIRCRRVNGSLYHICGGHVFNSKRNDVLDWFWQHFNRDKEFVKADRNSVVFMEDGKEIPYPIENHVYLFPAEFQKRFYHDLTEIVRKENSAQPENFEEFLKVRFGNTLYETYFKPYNEKVWRKDLTQVPLTWLEGKLPMPTVEEMIYNNVNHVEEKAFVHSSFWYEKMGGSQFMADRLASGLDVRYNSEISDIAYNGCWRINDELFDGVVFCGNVKQLPSLLTGVDISCYEKEIDALDYHGTTSVFCEIDDNPYSWIYMPSRKHSSHRIICTGNFSSTNNSDAKTTGTIEFTDYISKEDILYNLSRIPLHPRYLSHHYSKYTYPIQDKDTRDMIKSLKNGLSSHHFYLSGRFADWEYYNMDVAVGAAMDLCKNIDIR